MTALIDLTGKTFGRLTVIRRDGVHVTPKGSKIPTWLCICECSNEVTVLGCDLRSGDSESCGCLRRELITTSQHPQWKGDDIGYHAAHLRVKRLRGRAADHECVDCEGPAGEWSYTYGCPRELISDRGSSKGCAYSPDPDRYVPRCKPCHRKFDAAIEAA